MSTLRPDRPIPGSEADLLGRGSLVSAIANQILDAPKDGKAITVGLNAQWGAGKSSFLNLLQERLIREAETRRPDAGSEPEPIVIRFNPWLFGSIEQLIRMFFADLAREVGHGQPDSDLGKQLERFGNIVAAASTIFPTGASELARLLAGEVKRIGRKAQQPPSLNQQKADINDALTKFGRRVVVFIDDVDRLEPDLTTLFFRMVRLNANFNSVIYVLAFDRQVVEQHLTHDSPGFGREYLEKIIQVSYNIPPPHPRIIPSLLKDEMVDVRRAIEESVFDERRYERLFDARRYDQVFAKGFAWHFNTVRSIKRYVNALRLTLPPVAGQVDLVDFYVIELIRLHYPGVYLQVTQNKYMLLDQSADKGTAMRRGEWLAKVRELLRELDTPAHLRDSVADLLCILFPDLDEGGSDNGNQEADRLRWGQEKRVCSRDAFDRFFSLAGEGRDADEVGGSVADGVASDPGIRKLFRHARRTGQMLDLLHELKSRDLGPRQAMRVAETVSASDTRDDLQLPDAHESYELIGDVVKNCMTWYGQGNEFAFLDTLIKDKDGSLFTACKVFEEVQQLEGRVGQNAQQQLQDNLANRILEDARSEGFWDGTRWYYLLSVARRLDREKEVLKVVKDRVVEPDGGSVRIDRLLQFCEAFPGAVRADRERGGAEGREEDIERWTPEYARTRLQMLVENGGKSTARAKAIVEDLWADG